MVCSLKDVTPVLLEIIHMLLGVPKMACETINLGHSLIHPQHCL